jgi:hypothetical protein
LWQVTEGRKEDRKREELEKRSGDGYLLETNRRSEERSSIEAIVQRDKEREVKAGPSKGRRQSYVAGLKPKISAT